MDTQAAAEASYHLNKRVSHYSQSFKVLNVAFGQINKISIGGKTAYSYTMSSSEPFVFYSDFQLATGSQLDHGGGYGGFMLGGVDGGITSIEVDFVKASSGRLLLIVGTTSDARTQQTIRSLSVK